MPKKTIERYFKHDVININVWGVHNFIDLINFYMGWMVNILQKNR